MLKIRCTPTDVGQTRHRNSQLTESEKAEFHTPAIPNMTRNCVKHSSVENISQDFCEGPFYQIVQGPSFCFLLGTFADSFGYA